MMQHVNYHVVALEGPQPESPLRTILLLLYPAQTRYRTSQLIVGVAVSCSDGDVTLGFTRQIFCKHRCVTIRPTSLAVCGAEPSEAVHSLLCFLRPCESYKLLNVFRLNKQKDAEPTPPLKLPQWLARNSTIPLSSAVPDVPACPPGSASSTLGNENYEEEEDLESITCPFHLLLQAFVRRTRQPTLHDRHRHPHRFGFLLPHPIPIKDREGPSVPRSLHPRHHASPCSLLSRQKPHVGPRGTNAVEDGSSFPSSGTLRWIV